MPRASQSKASGILEFFRSASLEVAEFAFGQVQDAMRIRRGKQIKGKQAAAKVKATVTKPGPAVATSAPAATTSAKAKAKGPAKVKAKAKGKKKAPRPTLVAQDPLPDVGADESVILPEGDPANSYDDQPDGELVTTEG